MDLYFQTKELCDLYGIKPARSRGQNFLINESVFDKIVELSELETGDTVLEIGPGLGFMTAKLSKQVKKVIAVELDDKLASVLKIALDTEKVSNVKIENQDILRFNPESIGEEYKVVANLPYNITSIFLRTFLSGPFKPQSMTLMLQKEVAERIVTQKGKMSLLALSVQYFGVPEIVLNVPSSDFWPKPEVDSAIVRIKNIKAIYKEKAKEKLFFRLAKCGFSAKRKMLKNNLSTGFHIEQEKIVEILKKINLKETVRAQELGVEDWMSLVREFEGG
jgi:16S rRNA (adenine1518-N6/adenine1519-N6)-dimethyltransferase